MQSEIQNRFQEIKENVEQAAIRSGRQFNDIQILAASKRRNVKEILNATDAGIILIGENTVQEALSKFEFLPPQLEKHMIGTLQPNKINSAIRLFDLIQSINSEQLANEVNNATAELNKVMPVLIEVNPAGEESKRGAAQCNVVKLVEQVEQLDYLQLRGFMAMLPHVENAESLRPLFQEMRKLFDTIRSQLGEQFDTLSMGMSNDYVTAIEEGSTMIRVGTTLFGTRGIA